MSFEDQDLWEAGPPDDPARKPGEVPQPEGSADAQDEDLFDFPVLETSRGGSPGARTPEPDPFEHVLTDEQLLEASEPEAVAEALSEIAAAAMSISARPSASAPRTESSGTGDLDEDLFGFPVIPGLSKDNPVIDPGDSEFDSPGDLLLGSVDEDLLALIESSADELEARQRTERPALEESIPTPAPAPAPKKRKPKARSEASPDASKNVDLPPEATAALATLNPSGAQAAATSRSFLPRNRLLWTLIGPSILANVVLVIFAWKASASFDSNVADLRNEIFDTVTDARRESLGNGQHLLRDTTTGDPTPDGYPDVTGPETPDALQTSEDLQLRIALEELDSHRFGDARLRLFRLLSLLDGMTGPRRDEVEAQASFLIARTYRLQARDMREAGR